MTCVVQITGGKDVGKTVLAEKIIAKLKEEGRSVVAVKISHHEPDPPTKDTHRLRKAGADRTIFYNGEVFVVYKPQLDCVELSADYVIIEGLRDMKIGYKIHIGPDAPSDADVIIRDTQDLIVIKCIDLDPCEILDAIKQYKLFTKKN